MFQGKMRTYTTITAAGVAVFAGLASASHPTIMSMNTSQFKDAYAELGVVPEVVANIDPATSFYFAYMEEDGDHALLMPGQTISLFEAQQEPFEFSVEGLSNVSDAGPDTRYLIYIADVDAPDRSNPTSRNLRHYLAGNFTVSGTSDLLETADKLVTNSTPFTPFTNPDPQLGTGVHRFLSALYVQPARFNSVGFEVAMDRSRVNWSLSEWRTDLGLGPAIGATVWMVNTTDEGTLNAASGISMSPWTMMGALSAAMFGAFAML